MKHHRFGKKSLSELEDVRPKLVETVHRALYLSLYDFAVLDGIRTSPEQNVLYKRGASTKDGYDRISKHQIQPSGYGEAVDLVPYINGRVRWEWEALYYIAEAMRLASQETGMKLRWGGCWLRIDHRSESCRQLQQEYVQRCIRAGRRAFTDGPHFEYFGEV